MKHTGVSEWKRLHFAAGFLGANKEVNENKGKIEKAINLSIEKYCGIYHIFEKFTKISFEIHYL